MLISDYFLKQIWAVDSSGGPSYVFNGVYHPLACKIVQEMIRPSNPKQSITDSLKELQSPHKLITASAGQASKVVLVYFIGGYTLAEVAAFRLMQANLGLQFIIAGTSNISGKSLIKSILVWLNRKHSYIVNFIDWFNYLN